jgi:hypothetical protein
MTNRIVATLPAGEPELGDPFEDYIPDDEVILDDYLDHMQYVEAIKVADPDDEPEVYPTKIRSWGNGFLIGNLIDLRVEQDDNGEWLVPGEIVDAVDDWLALNASIEKEEFARYEKSSPVNKHAAICRLCGKPVGALEGTLLDVSTRY